MHLSRFRRFAMGSLLSVSLVCAAADEQSVHIYNWYDYIAPSALKGFEQDTGIGVVYDVFDNSDVMQGKLLVGHSGYDVVVVTGHLLPNLVEAGVLQELDRSRLPNWKHLDPDILAKLQGNDPGNRYAVPYLWGTTGIGYDVDKVKALLGEDAPFNSWDLIFKEENLAKLSHCGVAILDAPDEVVPIALHYLGLPPNSRNPADYRKAGEFLLKLRPYVRYFDSSRFRDDLANGNICVALGWSGAIYKAQEAAQLASSRRVIDYSIPREGAPVWMENMVLLKDAPHPHHGLAFINYMLRPEVIAQTTNFQRNPNANRDATALVDQAIRDNPMVYPPKQVLETLFPLEPLPLPLERQRTRIWNQLKVGLFP